MAGINLMDRHMAIAASPHIDNQNGSIISTKKALALPAKDIAIAIEPVQDLHGFDNPWPAGGGKNKYSGSDISLGNGNPRTIDVILETELPAGTYYISWTFTGDAANYGIQIIHDSSMASRITPGSVTVNDTIKKVYFYMSRTEYEGGKAASFKNIQIESGSTATPYAPYSNICPISGWTGANVVVSPTTDAQDGTTYPISWQSEAGTVYGGTLDVTTGLLTVDRAMVYLETLSWTYSSGARFISDSLTNKAIGITNIITSYYATTSIGSASVMPNNTIKGQSDNSRILVRDDRFTVLTDFVSAIAGQTAVYKLAQSQTYQLTPTEVTLLLGDNNVWADTGDITMKFWSH